jgi:hypothetical protein
MLSQGRETATTASQPEPTMNTATAHTEEESETLSFCLEWARSHWIHALNMREICIEKGMQEGVAYWTAKAAEGEAATEKFDKEFWKHVRSR